MGYPGHRYSVCRHLEQAIYVNGKRHPVEKYSIKSQNKMITGLIHCLKVHRELLKNLQNIEPSYVPHNIDNY